MSQYDEHNPEYMPEGKEPPPKGTTTMATVRWLLLGAMTLFALIMVLVALNLTPWGGGDDTTSLYHCPMHPTYTSNQPGECPICGMDLVSVGNNEIQTPATAPSDAATQIDHYVCPMHPDVVSDTAGLCPICGMELEPVMKKPSMTVNFYCPMHPEVTSDSPGECHKCGMDLVPLAAGTYFCPMHPEVVSDTLGECPKCGMDLVPRSGDSTGTASATDHSAHGVPGLVPVTIEQGRVQLIGLQTERASRERLSEEIEVVGYVTADESKTYAVSLRVSGWVQRLFVSQTGESVKKGAPLLSIYSPELYQAEQELLISYTGAQERSIDTSLSRTREELFNASVERLRLLGISQSEIDQVLETGQPRSEVTLRSPVNGVVLEKSVSQGQSVSPNQTLYTVAELGSLWVLADVYESALPQMRVGQEVDVRQDGAPIAVGRVDLIYPTIATETRTAKVRITLTSENGTLRPGMFVTAFVRQPASEALTVSRSAVMDEGRNQYVFVVKDNTHFEPRHVVIGSEAAARVEILAGLTEGETVVTSGNFLIDSESRLKAAIGGSAGHDGHGE